MRWTELDEKQLQDLVAGHKSIEDLASALRRSPEAISMKLTRLGLAVPEKSSVEKRQIKLLNSLQQRRCQNWKLQRLRNCHQVMKPWGFCGLLCVGFRSLMFLRMKLRSFA